MGETSKKTSLITSGRNKAWTNGLVNTPVMRASTRIFDSYSALKSGIKTSFEMDEVFYGRMGTPSQWSLRDAVSDLEGAAGTLLYPSGIAAITSSILALTGAGDHILITDNVYEPVRGFVKKVLNRMNITADYYDPMIGSEIESLFKANTKLILLETPGSLTFEVQDLPAIVTAAQKHDIFTVVDNTWATPMFYSPLLLGADVSINSATKYLSGHSDVMLGTASANERAWDKLKKTSFSLGQTVSADDAFLTLRGMRSLHVRLNEHAKQALNIARHLEKHPAVHQVLHPALKGCPGHDIFKRDFSGSTGLFSIILNGGSLSDCAVMVDHMTYFKMGFSWGGYESLVLPADPGTIRTTTKWQAPGPLLRLHIGLEDEEDLINDLDAGLARYNQHVSG